MLRVKSRFIAAAACVTLFGIVAFSAQRSIGPARGILILDGGGTTAIVRDRFVELAGGPKALIGVFPTGVSSLRFGEKNTILDPDWPRDRPEWPAYEAYLKRWLGTENVTVIHRASARWLLRRFRKAAAECHWRFLSAGNAGTLRLLDTARRGNWRLCWRGAGDGSSAEQSFRFVYRARPSDKPLLMAAG